MLSLARTHLNDGEAQFVHQVLKHGAYYVHSESVLLSQLAHDDVRGWLHVLQFRQFVKAVNARLEP